MFNHHATSSKLGVVLAAVLIVSALGATPLLADTTQFSGQATGLKGTLLGTALPAISDTGPLPPGGGQQETSLLSASLPGGLGTAEVFHSSTIGQGDRSRSEAALANLNLTVGGNTIGADLLMARAMAVCNGNGFSSISGSSEIAALVINGQTITVSGQPNQTVTLPFNSGQVIINEQKAVDSSDITVNALHVTVNGVADVIVASAHADVTCIGPPICDSSKDFVTGGGWILNNGSKANFAVAGGNKNGSLWGHLQYNDHVATKVKGTGVTAYVIVPNSTTRHIEGTCEVNGAPGFTYAVDVADNGEPGKGVDTFSIKLSNGYSAANTLGGGNIQLHKACQ